MNRLVSWSVALLAITVGVLSLFGVRPITSRATDIILGIASLALGVALLSMTPRRRIPVSPQSLR